MFEFLKFFSRFMTNMVVTFLLLPMLKSLKVEYKVPHKEFLYRFNNIENTFLQFYYVINISNLNIDEILYLNLK